jgi:hypothetical protein
LSTIRARLERPWARAALLAALAIALTTLAWWPALAAYPHTQAGDGQVYQEHLEAARASVVRYRELPLWNPYECAGLPLWDNPQELIGAPLAWPAFLVGTTRTLELWILAHVAMGFAAMWMFARRALSLSRWAAFVASAAWAYSGFHQHHYSGGHITFVPFLYFPFALLLWRSAERESGAAVLLGVLLAWMFYEGGVYPLPHLAVLLAAETVTRAVRAGPGDSTLRPGARLARIAQAAAVTGTVAVVLSASRLLPVLDQLASHHRDIDEDVDVLRLRTLADMFLARDHGRFVEGQQYVWTEYGTYMGPIVLLLALAGVVLGASEHLWMFALLVFSGALMCGHFARWAPWHVLHAYVPPFKEMRVPSRFRASVALLLAAYAGLAIDRLTALGRGTRWHRGLHVVVVLVGLAGVADILVVCRRTVGPFFGAPPRADVTPSARLYYGGSDTKAYIDQPAQNRGIFECSDEWGFGTGAPLWTGDVPQVRAVGLGPVVAAAARTQNTFVFQVDSPRPARVLLNTSYDRGWQTSVGTTADQNKQLVVDVPAGTWSVRVRYWPRWLTAGMVVNALGLAALAAWGVRRRRPGSLSSR